ncbi:60S ribosomal protein L32 [Brettanomyces bruxellensis]|uniref:60S ribosomal protein L32 n=1 Tax=Dekkera bruxellensis TaxID=5007 RepID=A0A3F2XZ86_DEKBR|nr:60S ribosomal protein L32 [Brettanomyces bruxellensis]EIF49541.1 60s ribosomal protein l32 [Brettanomyces bruxellensis AWRI1499]KAF6010734.1 60S ribosomal protein L32 [Brettanomyces bruxellensis]KAF6013195.1 60S ribosomal protein L32 [Brettanomyces bruxellensis]QOU21841.1 60S ribosomal protein L32 [Brettanomyces bruxellensis]VUG15894.1 RPL32 [Brettanomyces bruxellensis]
MAPRLTPKIVKKNTKKFKRHQSDRFKRVDENWRLQKGIDSRIRRRFRGTVYAPKIGYGSNKKTKFLNVHGQKVITVRNIKELDALLMNNKLYAAEIAHNVSAKHRVTLLARAKAIGVKVTNPKGRLTLEA